VRKRVMYTPSMVSWLQFGEGRYNSSTRSD
jgi:hypothetical protein